MNMIIIFRITDQSQRLLWEDEISILVWLGRLYITWFHKNSNKVIYLTKVIACILQVENKNLVLAWLLVYKTVSVKI